MPYSRRDRIGYWIERNLPWFAQRPFMRLDGMSAVNSDRKHYVNRINRHLIVR